MMFFIFTLALTAFTIRVMFLVARSRSYLCWGCGETIHYPSDYCRGCRDAHCTVPVRRP